MKSLIKAGELEQQDWNPVKENIIDFVQDKMRL